MRFCLRPLQPLEGCDIFIHTYYIHTLKDKLYILCIFTLQCCAQAPLTRQRSTPNHLWLGLALLTLDLHSTSKNLFCCFSVWGQIYRTSHPETPPARSKAVTHILPGGWCKLTGRQKKRVGKIIFS